MGADNPFLEPDDSDRTVIRPAPGGRGAAPRPTLAETPVPHPAAAAPEVAAGPSDLAEIAVGTNPLLVAAAPLLQLLGHLRNTLNQPDPGELRERAIRGLRTFEARARDGGVPLEQLRPAHYALSASLDDVVLNTPWGSQGPWAARSIVSTFHQEVRSGVRFFDLLQQLVATPGANLPVLELMYLCLSLGFQGRYRLSPRGPGELDKVREDLYAVIVRQRGAAPDPELSPHWRGVAAPYRPARAQVPIWVMGTAAAAILAGVFVWLSRGLEASSDDVFARAMSAPPARMPQISRAAAVRPPPPAAEPGAVDTLRQFLKPEIDAGLVSVLGTGDAPLVRITGNGMFPSGSATLNPRFVPLLERIGQALRNERGPVLVTGHSDNQPIHSIAFPSNFALSGARAQAARAVIARALGDAGRITAEGRADTEPLASNATPAGQAANRRIEVLLQREK